MINLFQLLSSKMHNCVGSFSNKVNDLFTSYLRLHTKTKNVCIFIFLLFKCIVIKSLITYLHITYCQYVFQHYKTYFSLSVILHVFIYITNAQFTITLLFIDYFTSYILHFPPYKYNTIHRFILLTVDDGLTIIIIGLYIYLFLLTH